MGLMDNMKDKLSDSDEMRDRMEQLKTSEKAGELNDKGREELDQLRDRFDKN